MEITENVIALTNRNLAARQRQLDDCRSLLGELVCDWLSGIREPVLAALQDLADGKSSLSEQRAYLELRQDLQQHWPTLVEAVGARLTAPWRGAADARSDNAPLSSEDLQLVDDELLTEQIMVRELAARLGETCSQELYGLERRAAVLLGQEEALEGESNPFGTQAVCQALNAAADGMKCLQIDAGLRALYLRRLEQPLHAALPGIYEEINALLIKRGVLPELRCSFRRRIAAPVAAAKERPASSANGDELLEMIRKLAGAQPAAGGEGGSGGGQVALPQQALRNPDFVAALQQVQQIDWSAVPAVMPPGSNLVWQVRHSEAVAGIGQLETATIDIVAMLFDFIFEDAEVPAGVKALIGRLQIPVLKVALLDQQFFASREHPARYFLDDISGIALRWGGAVQVDDPFYLKLESLVTRIQQEFTEDVEVFSRAIDELEVFVDEHEAKRRPAAAAAAAAVAQRELEIEAAERAREAARQKAHAAVQPWLDRPIFPPIRDFFETHWQLVLEKQALDAPDDEVAWNEAVEFMDNLAWSISLKSRQRRNRLVALLPQLLAAISRGLDGIGVSVEARQPFLEMLFELHSANVKAAMSAPDGSLPEPEARYIPAPPNEADGSGELVVTRLVDDGVEVEEITLVGRLPPAELALQRQVQRLQPGDWIEFRPPEAPVFRARLNWVGPQKGMLLFLRQPSGQAISISPEALASQLGDGRAVAVAGQSLFERALNGVMQLVKKGFAGAPATSG